MKETKSLNLENMNRDLIAKGVKLSVNAPVSVKEVAGDTEASRILKIVKRSKNGVDIAMLKRKTGIDDKKIRSILYSAFTKPLHR